MKKQIITFIIGALVGAIITTGVFLLIKGNSNQGQMNGQRNIQMREFDGERPEMPDGEMPEPPNGEKLDENANNNAKGKGQTKTQEIKTDKSSNT